MTEKFRLPDPLGMIDRIKRRLNKKCAVRISPYCDYIISMKMQKVPDREIEEWLIQQGGKEARISAVTIWRNFKSVKLDVKLTYAEEMLDKTGGFVNLNLIREQSQVILVQKERVDHLVRMERQRQEQSPGYTDKRLRFEMELFTMMMKELNIMLQRVPEETAAAAKDAMDRLEARGVHVTEDATQVLTDMILNNEITVSADELFAGAATAPTTTTRQ